MNYVLSTDAGRRKQTTKNAGENMPKGNFSSCYVSKCGRFRIVTDGNDDFWMSVPVANKLELYPMDTVE